MNNLLSGMMEQAKKLQEQMEKAQKDLVNIHYEGQAGAGLVSVVMTGRYDLTKVNIEPSLLNEEKSLLEDLIAAAVNDAVRKIESANKEKIAGLGSGFDLPSGFKIPF